ncbi:PASTA domain-containing protein [Nocardioides rotundus]|uniref:PASTA domain-containing protein n=1 Tax=Nocardioides rotundus TaxID=1774216 RepID=UPI001CBEA1FD|nr:PASTA domain-containing protein [Nocardioides rotundus]UAL30020.1 PASTA domain-containing protein [Nocardioides rotundus]
MSRTSLSELMDSEHAGAAAPGHRGQPAPPRWPVPVAAALVLAMVCGFWLATRSVSGASNPLTSSIAAPVVASERPSPARSTPAGRRTVPVRAKAYLGLQRDRVVRMLERRGLVVLTVPVTNTGRRAGTVTSVSPVGRLRQGDTVRVEYLAAVGVPALPSPTQSVEPVSERPREDDGVASASGGAGTGTPQPDRTEPTSASSPPPTTTTATRDCPGNGKGRGRGNGHGNGNC